MSGSKSNSFPSQHKIIDLMLNIPSRNPSAWYEFMRPLLLDEQSRDVFKMPAEYMFKHIPDFSDMTDQSLIDFTIQKMNQYNIERALINFQEDCDLTAQALEQHADRFLLALAVDGNRGMEEVRKIKRLHQKYALSAVTLFPSGVCPQIPINDKKWYPIYAACIELDLPVCICVGVPGPRLPMEAQKVEHLDEVCWFFPELKVIMRHGGEPWVDLACKLMLKYPNLYYSTSAFSPKHYPEEIITFANTRGGDQIMYAGYFPMGMSLDDIFKHMPRVGLKEEVWPKFLYGNAARVFNLT